MVLSCQILFLYNFVRSLLPSKGPPFDDGTPNQRGLSRPQILGLVLGLIRFFNRPIFLPINPLEVYVLFLIFHIWRLIKHSWINESGFYTHGPWEKINESGFLKFPYFGSYCKQIYFFLPVFMYFLPIFCSLLLLPGHISFYFPRSGVIFTGDTLSAYHVESFLKEPLNR